MSIFYYNIYIVAYGFNLRTLELLHFFKQGGKEFDQQNKKDPEKGLKKSK